MCLSLSLNPMPQHFPEISPQRDQSEMQNLVSHRTTNSSLSLSKIPRLSHQGISPLFILSDVLLLCVTCLSDSSSESARKSMGKVKHGNKQTKKLLEVSLSLLCICGRLEARPKHMALKQNGTSYVGCSHVLPTVALTTTNSEGNLLRMNNTHNSIVCIN